MPSYSAAQKAAISQFVSLTSVKESAAARQLKASGWNVERAVNTRSSRLQGIAGPDIIDPVSVQAEIQRQKKREAAKVAAVKARKKHNAALIKVAKNLGLRHFEHPELGTNKPATASNLNKLFDEYRDTTTDGVDSIGANGSIKYFNDLGVKLDEIAVLIILTQLDCPTFGEFTREGFVSGWMKLNVDTIAHQHSFASHYRDTISTDQTLFSRVYKHTFLLALNPGQKAVQLDQAIEFWRLLLEKPGIDWSTPQTPWLTWWFEFLQAQHKHSVNKDMWNMTLKFVGESLKDESLSFWREDGDWPSVIDNFVGFVKEKREEAGTAMDTQ